jgi:ribulose-5-phosphate 4-epimerase/fuculose-1-phosphate aldolase
MIIRSMIEAGKITVDFRMVDSFFGNISYRSNDAIFISQTGSSLDELSGCIDRCPLDGSSCAGVTASSEFSAHRRVYELKNCRAILHGHPKYSVIMSMICDKQDCVKRGLCYRECEEPRFVGGIPVVPGEVGTGRFGLCNTMPQALAGNKGAIVYGHGLFTTGERDFREAFSGMIEIETQCMKQYEILIRR